MCAAARQLANPPAPVGGLDQARELRQRRGAFAGVRSELELQPVAGVMPRRSLAGVVLLPELALRDPVLGILLPLFRNFSLEPVQGSCRVHRAEVRVALVVPGHPPTRLG